MNDKEIIPQKVDVDKLLGRARSVKKTSDPLDLYVILFGPLIILLFLEFFSEVPPEYLTKGMIFVEIYSIFSIGVIMMNSMYKFTMPYLQQFVKISKRNNKVKRKG